jgi:mono/diheme cytochrome c family protein
VVIATLATILGMTGPTVAQVRQGIFRPFQVELGVVQSATPDGSLTVENKFFSPGLGTNGQSCATCHEPDQAFSIVLPFIRAKFEATGGTHPLFRTNDTADRPDADVSTVEARRQAFRLKLDLGLTRIARPVGPATRDYEIEFQNTPRFGPQPNTADPQAPGQPRISTFRRPLINTNVHFDSAVLWDGRVATPTAANMRAQVQGAARALLLAGVVTNEDADEVASFMTGVFTAQEKDDLAGTLHARGATGGVDNLVALSQDPAAPCTSPPPPVGVAPATCTPVTLETGKMTVFDAWTGLRGGGINEARAAVARGQAIFNEILPATATLPPRRRCASCHAVDHLGNNPNPNFFVRLNLDSVARMEALAAVEPRLSAMVDRVRQLPEFCVRRTSSAPGTCDDLTTDPGRATVSGQFAHIGQFKPPILRGLAGRPPFFHNGAAESLEELVLFYNVRFNFGLTAEQQADLVAFLRGL